MFIKLSISQYFVQNSTHVKHKLEKLVKKQTLKIKKKIELVCTFKKLHLHDQNKNI